MSKIRQQRTADQIHVIMSQLFQRQMNDPRLQGLTITGVQIDRELQYADIYVNALGAEERQKEVMIALNKAGGYLRHELAQRVRLRTVPQLHFHWDPTLAQSEAVNQILDGLEIPALDEDTAVEDSGDF
ncbi:MAG: 30S ribosome-binding factor RbfA [Anaerolineae bacterium]